jgi:hypothetical protein
MNTTLAPLLKKCVLVFFDDILIYSKTLIEHTTHLQQVLQLLAQDSWQVKLFKCSFAQRKVNYLGHVISEQGVSTDPVKIVAIQQWPSPGNVKQLRSFFGTSWLLQKICATLWNHLQVINRAIEETFIVLLDCSA